VRVEVAKADKITPCTSRYPFTMKRGRPKKNFTCPRCGAKEHQIKNGKNPSGTRRLRCGPCGRYYTVNPAPIGFDREEVNLAVDHFISAVLRTKRSTAEKIVEFERMGDQGWRWQQYRLVRKIARIHGINHQTLRNWIVKWRTGQLPDE